jgi:hypothetical protein
VLDVEEVGGVEVAFCVDGTRRGALVGEAGRAVAMQQQRATFGGCRHRGVDAGQPGDDGGRTLDGLGHVHDPVRRRFAGVGSASDDLVAQQLAVLTGRNRIGNREVRGIAGGELCRAALWATHSAGGGVSRGRVKCP